INTELDDILMSIEESSDDLCFHLAIMKELNLELPEYSPEEAALIRKSQQEEISEEEELYLEMILSKEREILDNQEDMVKAYLAQCNRNILKPKLNIH